MIRRPSQKGQKSGFDWMVGPTGKAACFFGRTGTPASVLRRANAREAMSFAKRKRRLSPATAGGACYEDRRATRRFPGISKTC